MLITTPAAICRASRKPEGPEMQDVPYEGTKKQRKALLQTVANAQKPTQKPEKHG